jgi:transaldolase
LKGKAAVANSRIIYERYREFFASKDFDALSKNKANIQRVLWGSTSTKNPEYTDIKYVTEIIAPDTVNTLPENTLNAFLDHGKVQDAFTGTVASSQQIIYDLKKEGIDINQVCSKLLEEGVSSFNKAFDSLMTSIDKKAASLCIKS